MTLFPKMFEAQHGINTSPESVDSRIPNTVDRVRETTVGVMLDGQSANYICNLPEDYKVKQIGSFEDAYDFYGVANDNSALVEAAA